VLKTKLHKTVLTAHKEYTIDLMLVKQ